MRRIKGVGTVAVVLFLAACGSNASTTSLTPAGGQGSPTSPTKPAIADPLDGTTWRNTITCDEVSSVLERAGLQKYEQHVLSGYDCDGPVHDTLAFSDGDLRQTGNDGEVETAPYQIVDAHTFVWEFLRQTYRVQGDRLVFSDIKIIPALYPYDPKIMPQEHALLFGVYTAAPWVRVN